MDGTGGGGASERDKEGASEGDKEGASGGEVGGVRMEGSKTWRVEVTCRAFMTRTFSFIPYNGAIENWLGDTCQCYGTVTRTGRKRGRKVQRKSTLLPSLRGIYIFWIIKILFKSSDLHCSKSCKSSYIIHYILLYYKITKLCVK